MKQLILAIVTVCTLVHFFSPLPALADAPQPGLLQMTLTSKTVTLGEPIILVYKVTNVESRKIGSNINENPGRWLNVTLIDPLGHSVRADSAAARVPLHGGLAPSQGSVIDGDGSSTNSVTGSIVVDPALQPAYPGQYRFRLTTHQKYYWNEAPGEPIVVDQEFLLPVTVTAKNTQRLFINAEKLRQTVLHGTEYRSAVKQLFAMRDPDCLPIWRELATDPSLDAFRATGVINELVKVDSISASDILAEMQPVAPERWARTGLDPLNALEGMRRNAGPELTRHINHLLVAAGINLNHVPYGSVN